MGRIQYQQRWNITRRGCLTVDRPLRTNLKYVVDADKLQPLNRRTCDGHGSWRMRVKLVVYLPSDTPCKCRCPRTKMVHYTLLNVQLGYQRTPYSSNSI